MQCLGIYIGKARINRHKRAPLVALWNITQ